MRVLLTDLTQVHYVFYLKLLCFFLKYSLILIRSEYPSTIRNLNTLTLPYKLLFEKWIFRLFDGFILMTNSLFEYFNNLKSSRAKTCIIPMTVDLTRFSSTSKAPFSFEYIVYAGSLSNEKDGIDILINAFGRIALTFKDIRLVIIGDNSNSNRFKRIMNQVNKFNSNIKERIVFTGRIDSTNISSYLCNAKIMALARPNSIQAQGGFPTKLGEYLATGNPVVISEVGEIPLYLAHKKNALLCKPSDVDDFALNLEWVLNNYNEAKIIGHEGRRLAREVFNSKIQAKKMSSFLQNF